MHGKYSFVETLIERLIQQVRKHEKQVKAYDEAFTSLRYDMRPTAADVDAVIRASAGMYENPDEDPYGDVTDANPERRGNGCAIYRVNS